MGFGDDIKKRLKWREDIFLRHLFGIVVKMPKAEGKEDAWGTIHKAREM